MGEARAAGRVVAAADAVPDLHAHRRAGMAGDRKHLQTIAETALAIHHRRDCQRRCGVGRGGRGRRASVDRRQREAGAGEKRDQDGVTRSGANHVSMIGVLHKHATNGSLAIRRALPRIALPCRRTSARSRRSELSRIRFIRRGAGRGRTARGRRRVRCRRHAAQRLLRPDARALPGIQRRVRRRTGRPRPATPSPSSQSHGGSGKQARSVIDGLEADVVTLALAYDIDEIADKAKLLARRLAEAPAAQQRAVHVDHHLPGAQGQSEGHQGLGRPGQAGRLGDHRQPEDLGRRALGLPRRLRLRAAAAGRQRRQGARLHRASCSANVPVLDSGARGSTVTFAERGIGDVLLAWENEAYLSLKEFGADKFDIVYPPTSILAEPPVAVVDKVVDKHGTRDGRRRPTSSTCTRPKARRSRRRTSTGRSTPKVAREVRDAVPEGRRSSPSTRSSAAGPRRRRRTSPTAACSTRSTARSDARSDARRGAVLPGPGAASDSLVRRASR